MSQFDTRVFRFHRFLPVITFLTCAISFHAAAAAQALDKFVIKGDAAKKALTKVEISAETAEKLAKACEAYAIEHNTAVSIFILSPSGGIVHAHRMDGQGPINIDTALYKAQTALYNRRPTSPFEKQYETELSAQAARLKLGQYYVSGGLPIIVDDQLIGAIGVGGSRQYDETCAYEALTKVIGPQPPLPASFPAGSRPGSKK